MGAAGPTGVVLIAERCLRRGGGGVLGPDAWTESDWRVDEGVSRGQPLSEPTFMGRLAVQNDAWVAKHGQRRQAQDLLPKGFPGSNPGPRIPGVGAVGQAGSREKIAPPPKRAVSGTEPSPYRVRYRKRIEPANPGALS